VTAVELELLRRQAYVDGAWVDADSGETFPVTNPATGEVVTEVLRMGAAETSRALAAAERTLPEWKHRTAKSRALVLRRLSDFMLEHEDDLARLMVTGSRARDALRQSPEERERRRLPGRLRPRCRGHVVRPLELLRLAVDHRVDVLRLRERPVLDV
jgi:hypothetical protein